MKLVHGLALLALLLVIVSTSINCVQNNNSTAQPSPASVPTATPQPVPSLLLTTDEKHYIYNLAISDPYVKDRIIKVPGKTTSFDGTNINYSIGYSMGDVVYMSCHETGPGIDRNEVLPAAIILTGNNLSQAGANVVAFVNTTEKRVVYVGFVPRPGVSADNLTYTSEDASVLGKDASGDIYYQLENVTIVDTGYTQGMSLTQGQKDQATQMAMENDTVRSYIGSDSATVDDIRVYGYEGGYPYRYILAYPMVTIDVYYGSMHVDAIYVLADLNNDRIVRVIHGLMPLNQLITS